MTTVLTHAAIPLGLGLALGRRYVPPRLLLAGLLAAILPDLDVLAFRFGIAYSSTLGHRGFSHSFALALLVAALGWLAAPWLKTPRWGTAIFLGGSMLSHALLDMLTNGGLGVALAWPFSEHRYFFPTRMIEVSPLRWQRFLGEAGRQVLYSELRWVWLPTLAIAIPIRIVRKMLFRCTPAPITTS